MAVTLVYVAYNLLSCRYFTVKSQSSMSNSRSQQTHVHATNIMHTVSTTDSELTDTSVDYRTILDRDKQQ